MPQALAQILQPETRKPIFSSEALHFNLVNVWDLFFLIGFK